MGKIYDELTPKLIEFILQQKLFFVGTAPLSQHGHVNISPKGMDSFRVLDSQTVAYLDVTGSGVETISHVKENGRLVFMFCAFDGKPLILRLHGKGSVVESNHDAFQSLRTHFVDLPGERSIIKLIFSGLLIHVVGTCRCILSKERVTTTRTMQKSWDQRVFARAS